MSDQCGSCKKTVKETQSGIQCSLCKFWYHAKSPCAEASEALVKFLESEDGQKSGVHWYCRVCEIGSKKLFDQMVIVENRLTSVEKQLGEIKKSIENLSKKHDNMPVFSPPAPAVVDIDLIAQEISEREKRKCNIVISGVKDGDESLVERLIHKIDRSINIGETIRLGSGSDRPLLVKLGSEREKWKTVGKARAALQNDGIFAAIFVNPDLTKREREKQYFLRQELKERRENGEDVMIKRGAVVSRPTQKN